MKMFKKNGTLNIPVIKKTNWHKSIVKERKTVIKSAYCPNGHNLMSEIKIDGYKGVHFLYRELKSHREADIVITAVVGECTKVYLNGEPFKEDETVSIYCPDCKEELLIHGDCKCGAHDYLFFLDEKLDKDCAQTFCSRIGCVKSSKLHVTENEESVIVKEAKNVVTKGYCPNGHSLMSDVRIDQHKGIHLIYKERDTNREAEIVITATVRNSKKIILKGESFKEGEIVDIHCPTCRVELPMLFDCECGAPIYLFFLDNSVNYNNGLSFCSRIGCVKSSGLNMSQQMLREYMIKHCS